MENLTEITNKLDKLLDYAVSLELDILDTQDQIHAEEDETHIIFLTDHLGVLQYELDQTNAEIYLFRQKLKILENEHKLHHPNY